VFAPALAHHEELIMRSIILWVIGALIASPAFGQCEPERISWLAGLAFAWGLLARR
jgi:hypothetical protein